MRIALLADAHANLPALEAVLADADSRACDAVWYLGDFVGYGPFPEETVRRLQETCDACIRGNYDRKVLRFPQKREKWRRKKDAQKFRAFEFAYDHLSAASRAFLEELEPTRRLEAAGVRVLLAHGSSDSDSEHLDLNTAEERFRELAAQTEANLICCGHSHVQLDRTVDDTRFVNPGAVGRPEGGDPRACYAIVEIECGRVTVELLRLTYDVERTASALRQYDLPDDFSEMLRQGRNLDEVREDEDADASTGDDLDDTAALPPEAHRLSALAEFADRLAGDRPHFEQVTRLALRLFDELEAVHGLADRERFLLNAACLLHDVGWVNGQQGHHKAAARLILDTPDLPLADRERPLVAAVARYHRKALPKTTHKIFGRLGDADKERVELLAGLLRVADGLDRTHRALIRDVACVIERGEVLIRADSRHEAGSEAYYAQRKADLLERALGRAVRVECTSQARTATRQAP